MPYQIEFKPSAAKYLKKLPTEAQKSITQCLNRLAVDPLPPGVEKLEGIKDIYRIRVGDYRIIYSIKQELVKIIVIRIGHRREIYRMLKRLQGP